MLFYRFGDIPEDECSSIWNNNDEVIEKKKDIEKIKKQIDKLKKKTYN